MAKQTAPGTYPVRDIPLKDIDRSRNYRIPDASDKEKLESLTAAIKVAGQLQAARVYERSPAQKDPKHKEPYILGFGDRRCRAQLALGKTTVRAEVYPPASDIEIEQARAIENLHRDDISPLEEVQAVANMLDALKRDKVFKGDPYEEVATRLARSVTWVRDRDYLHRLTDPVKAFVMRAGLPAGHLRELAKVGDPADQMQLACDAAGAPVWPFQPSNNGSAKDTVAAEIREDFFAKVAEGGVQRWPLSKLKKQVDTVKRSLKIVPWEYHEPVENGKTKLRACKDCRHNSETDRTLFGLESESDNPRGYCLNASCFVQKTKATDAAKGAVLQKIGKRQDQSPAAIKRSSPRWLKDSTVVGFVQRELKKAAENGKKPEAKPVARKPVQNGRKLTPHEEALLAFMRAEETWQVQSFRAILKGINGNPVYRVGWCVLAGTHDFQNQENWAWPTVNAQTKEPCTLVPTLPKLPSRVKQAITLAMTGTKAAWVELADWTVQDDPDNWDEIGWIHPDALVLLAEAIGVKIGKRPEWKAPAPTNTKSTPVKA